MNYYVIQVNGKEVFQMQSKKDKYDFVKRVAATINPAAVVRKVVEGHFKIRKVGELNE
ncbi:hypothetical protein [Priestia aryabhattai]|uniref:Uncharacterized protein n=1 Tax=Priestia aryabhattai TaxID=412384 RepID=A0ABD7X4Q1_PRIAR|nr:hypothetical protein [Priestia aryabhattai]WEA47323.1 hypothetical protein PWO00_28520 [Priestia aryabhattai]